ncbi:hypothetical protein TKK_0018114 [Trichogramma kaykai]
MDRVAQEFHRNVALLAELVAPHDEFKKHFKEGMFDKPNTLGFIHVSYYLLTVLYKDAKSKVQWPVICKQTENKFRNDVRECLMVISGENPDLNFPPIFASHLLLARGSKFLLIMWKFSLAVMRTYLQREHHTVLPFAPKSGPCSELTKTFLKNVSQQNKDLISNYRKERENIQNETKDFQSQQQQWQTCLKDATLRKKEELKEVINKAPVNESAKRKLLDVTNNEIIEMWLSFINKSIKTTLEKDSQSLRELDEFLKSINNVVTNLTGNSQILNGLLIEKIKVEPVYEMVPPEAQVLLYNMNCKDGFNLKNLFSVFTSLIMKHRLTLNDSYLKEYSKCNVQLEVSNHDLKVAINHFQNLHDQVKSFSISDIKNGEIFDDSQGIDTTMPEFLQNKVLFLPSPSIQINSYFDGPRNTYQNQLKLTPIEGAHRELFSRHIHNATKGIYSSCKKPLLVQRINFDESNVYDTSSDKYSISQKFNTPSKLLKSNFKNVGKYSRIFSARKPNDSRVNNSVMMMMSSTGNSMLPFITKPHCISLMDSCNSSQEMSQDPLLLNPHLNSTMDPKVKEQKKSSPKPNRRRSIGDLVERYKKLLKHRDDTIQLSDVTKNEPLGEELII